MVRQIALNAAIEAGLWLLRGLMRLGALLARLCGEPPAGFTLVKADGGIPGRIRGDLIPAGTLVIVDRGRRFVRTGELDDQGFEIYTEGHNTFEYASSGE